MVTIIEFSNFPLLLSDVNIYALFIFQTLTHLRIAVNIFTGIMLGTLFIQAGNEGSRVIDNYNLLFAILMHHMMTTMMLTILTC